MSLLHPALLYGLILACIPVVLHYFMRARPKKYDFPALRLLENIRKQNIQRLRLRHLWLLLLRVLLIAGLVLAAARPTLPAANYALSGMEWGTLLGLASLAGIGYLLGSRLWAKRAVSASARANRNSKLQLGTGLMFLAMFLLLVGWPYQQRVQSEMKAPADLRQLNVPVAAVYLFDYSASMGYLQSNQTRLQKAFVLSQQQARQLPKGSLVAISDNAQTESIQFLNDLSAAVTRLERSEARPAQAATWAMNDRVISAINLQISHREKLLAEQSNDPNAERFLREIYIYTDLTRTAWSLEQAARLRTELERVPWLRCYLIDVGVKEPVNYSLSRLSLSRERTVPGSSLRVAADVHNESTAQIEGTLEFYLEDQTGQAVKRDQQTLTLEPNQTAQVAFPVTADSVGPIQGYLKLTNPDPLEKDNQLPFTIQVESRSKIGLIAENPEEAFVWQQALAPDDLVRRGSYQYEIERLTPQQWQTRYASGETKIPFDAVYLMNVSRLSSQSWSALQKYVETGGGLGIVLGSARVDAANYREFEQSRWLPALPEVHSRATPPVAWEILRSDHPTWDYLKRLEAISLFSSAEVNRFWKMTATSQGDVLARFQDPDQSAAVVSSAFGQGRVMMIGTAVDLAGASEQRNWSELARLGWIYAAWADQMTKYLSGQQGGRLNRSAGETVSLTVSTPVESAVALLQLPGLRQGRIELPYRGPLLTLNPRLGDLSQTTQSSADERLGADQVGNYRLVFPESRSHSVGFSIHLPDAESNLSRLSEAELDELFGQDRWQVAENLESLERSLMLGRVGQEVYGLLIAILIAIFLGEHLMANLFYGRGEREAA